MDPMNPILSHIYGTGGGLEKTAAALPDGVTIADLPSNLSQLADVITSEITPAGSDLVKVASVQKSVLEDLINTDAAGRYMAQVEFSEMEKSASEGDPSALQEFFSDVDGPNEPEQRAFVREQVRAELVRRGL